jgi:hypothetical protein
MYDIGKEARARGGACFSGPFRIAAFEVVSVRGYGVPTVFVWHSDHGCWCIRGLGCRGGDDHVLHVFPQDFPRPHNG